MDAEIALAQTRETCLALPNVIEKLSHGSPCFFVEKGRQFVAFVNNHHGDGRLALWMRAAPGMQECLVQEDPDAYFRPPYVGPSGWVGVCLDKGLDWSVVEGLLVEAHGLASPRRR